MMVLLFLWGVLAFGMSPAFQAGMLSTAERWTPKAVDFASALNIAAFNLGITLGETLGSAIVAKGLMAMTPLAGVLGDDSSASAVLVKHPIDPGCTQRPSGVGRCFFRVPLLPVTA